MAVTWTFVVDGTVAESSTDHRPTGRAGSGRSRGAGLIHAGVIHAGVIHNQVITCKTRVHGADPVDPSGLVHCRSTSVATVGTGGVHAVGQLMTMPIPRPAHPNLRARSTPRTV